jgi:hypothetical protein
VLCVDAGGDEKEGLDGEAEEGEGEGIEVDEESLPRARADRSKTVYAQVGPTLCKTYVEYLNDKWLKIRFYRDSSC